MEQTGVPPLAYSFVKNGLLHTEMNWLQTEDALFANTIGKSLVDFAYIDDESLRVVMMEIDSALLNMTDMLHEKKPASISYMEIVFSVRIPISLATISLHNKLPSTKERFSPLSFAALIAGFVKDDVVIKRPLLPFVYSWSR